MIVDNFDMSFSHTIMAKLTNQVQRTILTTPSTKCSMNALFLNTLDARTREEPFYFLPQAAPNDIQRLWTAIDRRIQALKCGEDVQTQEKTADKDHNEETKTEPDAELKGTEPEDDDDSVKDRCEAPDESSNESCPREEGRKKETVTGDD